MHTDSTEFEEIRVAHFVSRAIELGIAPARARFLAACSYNHIAPKPSTNPPFTVPYSDLPLVAEAARLGMTKTQAAAMMGMTIPQLDAFGIQFPARSTYRVAPGNTVPSLLAPDDATDETN